MIVLHARVEIEITMRYCPTCKDLNGDIIKRMIDPYPDEKETWELSLTKSSLKSQIPNCDLCTMLICAMQTATTEELDYPQLEAREDGILLIKENPSKVCLELYSRRKSEQVLQHGRCVRKQAVCVDPSSV